MVRVLTSEGEVIISEEIYINSVEINPTGKFIAIASSRNICILRVNHQSTKAWYHPEGRVDSINFKNDGSDRLEIIEIVNVAERKSAEKSISLDNSDQFDQQPVQGSGLSDEIKVAEIVKEGSGNDGDRAKEDDILQAIEDEFSDSKL